MSEEMNSALKVPVFNGEEKGFQSWMIRFMAYARVKGFSLALKDGADLPSNEEEIETLDPSNAAAKKQILAGKRNMLAMSHITMALGTESLLNKVSTVCDDDWPGGLAYKLIKLLKEEYQPEDRVATVEMKRKMNKIRMGKFDKTSMLIDQIKAIENQSS